MTLPDGYRVVLDPGRRTLDGGRLLVGGSPLTAMRLADPPRLDAGGVVVRDPSTARLAERLVATNLASPDLAALPPVGPGDLTVVVPVRDRPAQLERCLAALTGCRVVVVDDASHDPAAVAAVARRHGAQVVALSVNVGPAGARNAGLAEVRTTCVGFVDSDVEVDTADLLLLARHLADPAVALVGPRVVGRSRSARPRWFERCDEAASSLTLGTRPSTVRPGASVAWLPSACLVGRASVLRDAGGFDAAMRVGEDVDLVWRLVAAGHRVRYEPAVMAAHDVRPTVRAWLGRKLLYGSGGGDLARRHGDHVAPAILGPALAVAGAALLTRRPWALPVVLLAGARGARSVHRSLPAAGASLPRAAVAGRIAARGVGWAVRQESALLLRHWWPATALACLASPAVRRATATALLVDAAVALHERPAGGPALPVLLLGRRLDDLAYGAGLWLGAVRARSTACLRPRRPGARRSGGAHVAGVASSGRISGSRADP